MKRNYHFEATLTIDGEDDLEKIKECLGLVYMGPSTAGVPTLPNVEMDVISQTCEPIEFVERNVTIYDTDLQGHGCFKREIEVRENNFVSETPDEITIIPAAYGPEAPITYAKTVEKFLKNENDWFEKHIKKETLRHEHTLIMAKNPYTL